MEARPFGEPVETLKAYFGAALFKHGDLLGNAALAAAVEKASSGSVSCVLPQDFEAREPGPEAVRDADLKLLMQCDCAIFSFDGLELDSGTLVEFMFSKFLDMPCAVLRTDFRSGGDQGPGRDPWNLMCSFYPRTETLLFNSLSEYKRLLSGNSSLRAAELLAARAAEALLPKLKAAIASAPSSRGGALEPAALLDWASRLPGKSFETLCKEDPSFLPGLLKRKKELGLL